MTRTYKCADCAKDCTQDGPGRLRKVCPECQQTRAAKDRAARQAATPERARKPRLSAGKPRAARSGGLSELLQARVHELVEQELAATAKPEFERAVEAYLADKRDARIDARVEAKIKEALGK